MRYFEFLNTLDLSKNPLTEREAGLITDMMLLSSKPFNKPFKKLLQDIHQQNSNKTVTCFISYAWANDDLYPEELWTQEFIYRLADWLRLAGINVFIDRENSRFGNQMQPFMKKHVNDDDYIILVGTKTLKTKISSTQIFYNVNVEYEHIKNRIQEDSNNSSKASVIPLIISGKNKEALPDELFGKLAIEDFSGNGLMQGQANILINHLQALIAKLYNLQDTSTYQALWSNFQQIVLQRGNSLGNLSSNPYLYLQQAQLRQNYFGKNKHRFFSALAEDPHHHPIGNTQILNEILRSLENLPAPTTTRVTVISGLGGMGKTYFAKQLMLNVKNRCKSILWVDVESQINTNLYQKELEHLGFTAGEFPYSQQLQLFFDWLGDHPGWLLILDDVSSYQHIESYIPPQGGHVLITSRNDKWPLKYSHHPLKKLDNDESRELVKKYANKRSFDELAIDKLAFKLDYLPLALTQAAAYLAKHASVTIDYYIGLYEKQPIELFKAYTEHKNVWQTINISLSMVTETPETEALLYKCAIFGCLPLPLSLLAKWIGCSKIELNNRLETPLSYYLIQPHVEENTVVLHPIVSDILFAMLKSDSKKDKIEEGLSFVSKQLSITQSKYHFILINYLFEMLLKIKKLGKDKIFINPIALANALLPALSFLLKQDNMAAIATMEPQYLALLDNEIVHGDNLLHYKLLEKLLSIYTKRRETRDFEFIEKKYNALNCDQFPKDIQVKILINKGVIAIELGHFVQAIAHFEEIIKQDTLTQYDKARIYANYCTVLIHSNQKETAIQMANQGLDILSKISLNDEAIILRTYIKGNLAEMYINCGELEEAEKLRRENIADLENMHSMNGSRGESWNYYSLARIACRQGKPELARQHYEIFVEKMNKIFGNRGNWPTKYNTVAEELDKEIEQKFNSPDADYTPSQVKSGATY